MRLAGWHGDAQECGLDRCCRDQTCVIGLSAAGGCCRADIRMADLGLVPASAPGPMSPVAAEGFNARGLNTKTKAPDAGQKRQAPDPLHNFNGAISEGSTGDSRRADGAMLADYGIKFWSYRLRL
jgi:hypothetical protein